MDLNEPEINLRDKPELLIIGGVPRAGKTQLSRHLWEGFGIPGFGIDALVGSFRRLAPESGIAWTETKERTEKLAVAVKIVATEGTNLFGRYFIEGESITPAIAEQLRLDFEVNACFLVMQNPVLADILAFETMDPWVKDVSDDQRSTLVPDLVDRSARIAEACDDYGFPCIDMSSGNYEDRVTEAFFALLGNAELRAVG